MDKANKKKKKAEGLPRERITRKQVKEAGSLRGVYEKRAAEHKEIGATKAESFPRRVVAKLEKLDKLKKWENPAYYPGQKPPKASPAPAPEPKKPATPGGVGQKLVDIFEKKTKLLKETYL